MSIGRGTQLAGKLDSRTITPGAGPAPTTSTGAPGYQPAPRGGSTSFGLPGEATPAGARMNVTQAAGMAPSSVAPELIRARFCIPKDNNVTTIASQTGAVVSETNGWRHLGYLDRPTCFVPLVQLKRAVVFAPHLQPSAAYAAQAPFAGCTKAYGPGVIYCNAPGDWWANYTYPANGPAHLAPFVEVDCTDPAVAVALMALPGCMRWNSFGFNTSAAPGTVSVVVAANRFRSSVSLATAGIGAALLYFDFDQNPSGAAGAQVGFPMQDNGYATLEDQMNNRGELRVVASVATVHFQVIETE